MADKILTEAKDKMKKAAENLQRELGQIRAGRANASILDRVMVTYYGVPTPLNQMASITIPEARILMITPFDKTMIQEVEKAIMQSDIGITPANDGTVIRLVIPQLTEERRKELAKDVKKKLKMRKSPSVTFVGMPWKLTRNKKKLATSQKMICGNLKKKCRLLQITASKKSMPSQLKKNKNYLKFKRNDEESLQRLFFYGRN